MDMPSSGVEYTLSLEMIEVVCLKFVNFNIPWVLYREVQGCSLL